MRYKRIGEIAEINASQYKKNDSWDFIEYIDTGSVFRGVVDGVQQLIPGVDKIPSRARRKVKDGSVIYSTVRPNQEHYAYLEEPTSNTLVSTGFAVIDFSESEVVPKYCYYALTCPQVTAFFQGIAEQTVSTYPALNPSDIANLEIGLPSIEEQLKVVSIVDSIDKTIELNNLVNDYSAA